MKSISFFTHAPSVLMVVSERNEHVNVAAKAPVVKNDDAIRVVNRPLTDICMYCSFV
jgi:hypothetical protein